MKKISFTLAAAMIFMACSKDQSLKNETENALELESKAAVQGGQKFYATLTGEQETPNPADPNGLGDPDGSGTFKMTINPGQNTISYELTVSNIAPATAAHIHEAPFGSAGPVIQGLMAPTNGTSSGTITLSSEQIDEIRKDPSNYYVNVHNSVYPGGAIRGQLSKSGMVSQ